MESAHGSSRGRSSGGSGVTPYSNPRLDFYPNSRSKPMGRSLLKIDNMGPGAYDVRSDFGGGESGRPGSSSSMAHSHVPIEHRLVQRARGPPPGTYDVRR
jgi:hypothetical protein